MKKAGKKRRIVECHQHVNWFGYTPEKLIEHYDALGIGTVWLHTWELVDGLSIPGYQHLDIGETWKAHEKYPDRFIPFYAPDPRRDDAEERLKAWFEKGIRGFGEHKARIRIDNPDSVRLYKMCGEMGLPVLFHADVSLPEAPRAWYNEDIEGLARVLTECSQTIFIAHGPGWWCYISGDEADARVRYPTGPVKPGGKVPEYLDRFENLYADISAGSGLGALTRDRDFGMKFVETFSRKLLYGTDYFDRLHLDYLTGAGFPDEVLDRVLGQNAESLVPTG